MNPILYAFLSENFKKSFAKAFTCAANKDINNQLNVENSVNPKTTRGGSSKFGNALNRHRDRDRIRNHFEENIANSAFDPIGPVSPPERPPSDHDDDEDEDDEDEVLEIEESSSAMPMTSRFSSYVGCVMNRNNVEQGTRFNDKQVLLDVANFDKDSVVRASDPTVLWRNILFHLSRIITQYPFFYGDIIIFTHDIIVLPWMFTLVFLS